MAKNKKETTVTKKKRNTVKQSEELIETPIVVEESDDFSAETDNKYDLTNLSTNNTIETDTEIIEKVDEIITSTVKEKIVEDNKANKVDNTFGYLWNGQEIDW